jgi:MFS family permease
MSPDSTLSIDSKERGNLRLALNRPILIMLLLQLMGGMMLSPHRTFFPLYARELGYSAFVISVFATIRQMMGLLASLVGGSLSDSLGRKRTLLLGEVGFLLSSLVFLTRSEGAIGVLWALGGLGMGFHTLGGQSYLMDNARAGYLGILTALYNWGYTLGGTLSSPVAGFALDSWDYRVFGTALALFAALTIGLNVLVLPRSYLSHAPTAASWKRLFGYGELATRRPVILVVLLRLLPTVYWGMALVLLPILLDDAGASKTTIALYATVSQVIATLAQVAVGRSIDRFGTRLPTMITLSALTASILATAALPYQLWAVFAFGTLGAAAAWSLSTLLPSWVSHVAHPQERGRVLGWIHLWWNLGMILGTMAGGALFERWAGLPFLFAGVLNFGTIAVAWTFFRSTNPTQVPTPSKASTT